jgi:hypothetical protein
MEIYSIQLKVRNFNYLPLNEYIVATTSCKFGTDIWI